MARDFFDVGHPKPPKPPLIPPRYCYFVYEDTICYAKPLEGEEERMSGYQDKHGNAGYLLSSRHAMDEDAVVLPPLASVTVGAPPGVNGTTAIPGPVTKTKPRKHKPTDPDAAAPADGSAAASDITSGGKAPSAKPVVPAPPTVIAPKKQLKEVIFDPAEMEPKKLVPDKVE